MKSTDASSEQISIKSCTRASCSKNQSDVVKSSVRSAAASNDIIDNETVISVKSLGVNASADASSIDVKSVVIIIQRKKRQVISRRLLQRK